MSTRSDYESTSWYRSNDPNYQNQGNQSTRVDATRSSSSNDLGTATMNAMGSMTQNAMDLMVRMPLQMTAAGIQWMTSSMQRSGGSGSQSNQPSGSQSSNWSNSGGSQSGDRNSWSQWANPSNWSGQGQGQGQQGQSGSGSGDQDLSGDDLKYVVWTVVFTKPGFESVLEPQQSDLVNYSTDGTSFAAIKIARFLERARHGKASKPSNWVEHGYPAESPAAASRRGESANVIKADTTTSGQDRDKDKGWRIPGDDQKYLQFLYRIDWRLPRQEPEVTRVERVTIERNSTTSQNVS